MGHRLSLDKYGELDKDDIFSILYQLHRVYIFPTSTKVVFNMEGA